MIPCYFGSNKVMVFPIISEQTMCHSSVTVIAHGSINHPPKMGTVDVDLHVLLDYGTEFKFCTMENFSYKTEINSNLGNEKVDNRTYNILKSFL